VGEGGWRGVVIEWEERVRVEKSSPSHGQPLMIESPPTTHLSMKLSLSRSFTAA